MKVEIPQIYWHGDRESIMSIDFLPLANFFVTWGYDNEESMFIRFWQLEKTEDLRKEGKSKFNDKEDPNSLLEWTPVFKYGDKSQSRSPNVVKFSPMGTYMASAGCDDVANIWDFKRRYIEMGKTEMELRWGIFKVLRGHFSEISDLWWSRDEKFLVTASIDNTAILWSVEKGESVQKFEGHKSYVSGVTIDPFMNFIVTQSTDKTVKVYKRNMDSK